MIIKTRTGAHVNLEELIQFNKDLDKFSKTLKTLFDEVDRSVKELEKGWRDRKLEEFKTDFNKYTTKLEPLAEELKSYADFSEKNWIPLIEKHLQMRRK
jgi:uncharacterized protein YukE